MRQMLPSFGETDHCKPTALISGSPDKARRVADEYGIGHDHVYGYDEAEKLANDEAVDVVYIATPTGLHLRDALNGFAAGKHVMCEKPMASDADECDRMIAASEEAGKKLMIAYRVHFEPHNLTAIDYARNGRFGEVKVVTTDHLGGVRPGTWRSDPALNGGGGPLMDYGIYGLQAARYIVGEEPVSVRGQTFRPEGDPRFPPGVEALCTWQMKFPGGAMSVNTTGWDSAGVNRYRVVGDAGWYELEPATSYGGIEIYANGRGERNRVEGIDDVNQFAAELDHMAECVLNDAEPRTPGAMGRQDVYLMKKIYESADTGREMEV